MTWLAFVFALEAGWLPNGGFVLYEAPAAAGWRHYCVHPVMPYSIIFDPQLKAEGAWDEVFLRVEIRVN